MNREWSQQNKAMQTQLKSKAAFPAGIETLLTLRGQLMDTMYAWKEELRREQFDAMPFLNAKGYHSKTIAYSLWHIFRIEDIVAHTLILQDEQVFFVGDYQRRIGSPIITTGNELVKQQISDFSKALDLDALYDYAIAVKNSTDALLQRVSFEEAKRKMTQADKARLQALAVVSGDKNACWLIDYWCGKDIRGLIQMPFSRHWIMHTEAALRMKTKIQ